MIDWMDFGKIQEYKRNGLKKSQVARRLEVDYKTILKYWDMSPTEYAEAEQASKKRRKKADEYKDFVVECLTKYPDMSAAQVYDWIKERTNLETLDFKKRAFRNYVQEIRTEYGIKKLYPKEIMKLWRSFRWDNRHRWIWGRLSLKLQQEDIKKFTVLLWFLPIPDISLSCGN